MEERRSISERLARIPPGRRLLPADFVARNQRERILLAVAVLVSENGYPKTTIDAIAKTARVALGTFYENFASKEAAFLAAFDDSVELAAASLAQLVDPREPWPRQVATALRGLLELIAAEPARARLCLVEALGAGSAALERYQAMLRRAAAPLRAGRELNPRGASLPEGLELAIAGGLAWLVYQRLTRAEQNGLDALLPEMLEIALTPYLGKEEAARAAAAERGDSKAAGEAGTS